MKIVKVLMLIAALYYIGDRWESHGLSAFNWRGDGATVFEKSRVIGTLPSQTDNADAKYQELFTIPTGETKWMTPVEAEKENAKIKYDR